MNLMALSQTPELLLKQPEIINFKMGQILIRIWDLRSSAWQLAKHLDILSGDEVSRAGHFKFERDRNRFITARAGMRMTLAGILGDAADALRFDYGKRGKPSLWDQEGPQALCFNLSHSGNLAVLAVSPGLDIGVYVEGEMVN